MSHNPPHPGRTAVPYSVGMNVACEQLGRLIAIVVGPSVRFKGASFEASVDPKKPNQAKIALQSVDMPSIDLTFEAPIGPGGQMPPLPALLNIIGNARDAMRDLLLNTPRQSDPAPNQAAVPGDGAETSTSATPSDTPPPGPGFSGKLVLPEDSL